MTQYDVIVIGAGPAGMIAAIFAKRSGKSVVILEKMPKAGKKLLVTGAGRCNLLNKKLDASFYKSQARDLVEKIFLKFGQKEILDFFDELGLRVYEDDSGRIFPVTNQAATVLKVLELELMRLAVSVETGCMVDEVCPVSGAFELKVSGRGSIRGRKVILCGGGKSYPALGADGGAYDLAKKLGHSVIKPVPSTVPLLVKDSWCHFLQGQKVRAVVRVLQDDQIIKEVSGELLFTQYGLSGTAILDVSDPVSVALNRDRVKEMTIEADLLPFINQKELEEELGQRIKKGFPGEAILEGLLPHKFSILISKGKVPLKSAEGLSLLSHELKHKNFKVFGTRGWNEAEFTAGGIPTGEITEYLESKLQKGLYFAGEIIDIQAARGGYQLAWAWASGAVTGQES